MAVKIRLARRGRRKKPYYHVVVADTRAPRDGKFIEKIGSYNPMTKPATIELDVQRALEWIELGAQPTETARSILRFKGVMYKKHLQRGVSKGAMTQEEADQLFNTYVEQKEAKINERREAYKQERLAFHRAVNGTPEAVYKKEDSAEETVKEFQVEEAVEQGDSAEGSEVAAQEPMTEVTEEEKAQESVAEVEPTKEVEATTEQAEEVEATTEPEQEVEATTDETKEGEE